MTLKDKPNKVTTVLKVVVTGEFYDDDATGETLRYAVEQDLEDAGFDVDVTPLKEQEAIEPTRDKYGNKWCGNCGHKLQSFVDIDLFCCKCGRQVKWE